MLCPDGGERQQEQVQTCTTRSVEQGETLNELISLCWVETLKILFRMLFSNVLFMLYLVIQLKFKYIFFFK